MMRWQGIPGIFQSTLPMQGVTPHTVSLGGTYEFQSTLPMQGVTL